MILRSIARTVNVVAWLATCEALGACALLFGFDEYDDAPVATAKPSPDVSAEPTRANFELVVDDALRVEPGTSASLDVAVKRSGGGSGRIVVAIADPLPSGLELVPPATIEPEASNATLRISVRADAASSIHTLHVVATDAKGDARAKDVVLTLRGSSCTPDRGFGDDGRIVRLPLDAPDDAVALVVDHDAITVAFEINKSVARLNSAGVLQWQRTFEEPVVGLATDAIGGSIVVVGSGLRRLHADGGDDTSFGGDAGATLTCTMGRLTRVSSGTAALCTLGSEYWSLETFGPEGRLRSTDNVAFDRGSDANPRGLAVTSNAELVACGTVERERVAHAAFAQWLPSGAVDMTFGLSGRVLLGTETEATACAADDAGIIATGTIAKVPHLMALEPTGALRGSFGDGGVVPILDFDDAQPKSAGVAVDDGAVIAVLTGHKKGYVYRYLREGRLDPGFATGGRCELARFGLQSANGSALTRDRKLVVVAADGGGALLGRLWL